MSELEKIKKGDRVRVTYEFTAVTEPGPNPDGCWEVSSDLGPFADDGDVVAVEIIDHPLPTEDGLYESASRPISKGYNPYRLFEGQWYWLGLSDEPTLQSEADVRLFAPLYKLERKVTTDE